MKNMVATTSLTLNGLQLLVFLGVYSEEQLKKQRVTIDATIRFPHPPKACESDDLSDTYCYDNLITHLKTHLPTKKFQLIEHLTKELYDLFKNYFPPGTILSLRVTKRPNILDLTGGVTFQYGDPAFAEVP